MTKSFSFLDYVIYNPKLYYQIESESEFAQSLTLCNTMHCSLPGSYVHGIFQARILEWGAIAFSDSIFKGIKLYFYIFEYATLFFWLLVHTFSLEDVIHPKM